MSHDSWHVSVRLTLIRTSIIPDAEGRPISETPFLKIAHRGASGSYPENTSVAFEKAIEHGANMIDLDCHMTKDGNIVVIHDPTLNRTTNGRGLVKTKRLDELKKLDAGSWFGPDFKDQRILTLEEAIALTHRRSGLIIEIKNQPQLHLGIEIRILFMLNVAGATGRAIVTSSDYSALRRLRERSRDVRIGVLMSAEENEDPLRIASELKAVAVLVRKDLLHPIFFREARRRGFPVLVWTVNETAEIERVASMGVCGIVTDFPERLSGLGRDRKSTRLNSSHIQKSRMPSSA